MSDSQRILNTYNQDLMWSRNTVEKSIASPNLLRDVLIDMHLLAPQDCTGPMLLWKLMMKLIDHSSPTRAAIKQAWLYSMSITDYEGGNMTQFTADWRNLKIFMDSLKEDTTDSLRQYLKALSSCPNAQFRQHFLTLESVNDAAIQTESAAMTAALKMYRKLLAEGKWSVRSTKEQNAFHQKKKAANDKKTKANKASYDSDKKKDSETPDPQANQAQKTHDGQGHPIDRTPPKKGEPKKRINPLTKKEEHFCEDPHCKRWGNHATSGHTDWYKKLLENKERRKKKKAEESDDDAASRTGSTLRIPNSSEVP